MSETEKKDYYTFMWKIKNYSCCYQARGEYIESPTFTLENLRGTRWRIWFYPKGDSHLKTNENFVSYYLIWEVCGEVSETPPIDFSLEIVDEEGKALGHFERLKHVFSKQAKSWGWRKFIATDKLTEVMNSQKEDCLTLRCRIQHDKLKEQNISGSEASTVIVDRRFFEWDVVMPSFPNQSKSACFSLPDFCDFEVTLITLLEGVDISFHLKECRSELSEPIMFKLTLCDNKGSKIFSKCVKHDFRDSKIWKFPNFITKDLIKSCNFDSKIYEFKLRGKMYVAGKSVTFTKVEKLYYKSAICASLDVVPQGANAVTVMQHDFKNLFINKTYCDVTIQAGNEEFPAHKLVLRVRSPVFENMFAHSTSESETGIIKITDVDEQTMNIFLEFLYTGTVETLDFESAKKLLFAADKYQVPSLVNKCASFFQSVLSIENACEIISVADTVNCECLKTYVFDFIISNADNILMTPGWEEWIKANIELATKILSKLSIDLMRKYK